MREIKFRAWGPGIDKTMHYNTDISGEGKFLVLYYDYSYEEKENYILMQYTGLKDANGKEIYEGDIVKATSDQYTNENFIGKVIFDEGYFCTWVNKNDIRGIWGDDNIEVIGNIFENKDLLEKEL